MNNLTLWQSLIPILAPILTTVVKYFLPRIPKLVVLVIPVVLGSVSDFILERYGLSEGGVIAGALLGAVGIAAREYIDQGKKAVIAIHDKEPLPKAGDKTK